MPAANLLVGSTCGSVYIVRSDPSGRTATLKTTISAGAQPIQICIDIENRSFYCLDRQDGEREGRLLTLGPTEFGSIEEKASIGTGAQHPTSMIAVGKSLYVCHKSGYTTFSFPKAPKSTRRRRKSSLAPVAEDSVAETLNELYAISKTMDSESTVKVPGNTLEVMQQQLDSSSQMDVVQMVQQVKTEEPILKFAKRNDERYIYGVTKHDVGSYLVMHDGSLIKKQTHRLGNVIDCDSDGTQCYVLCADLIIQMNMADNGDLEVIKRLPVNAADTTSIKLAIEYGRAYIVAAKTVLSIHLETGKVDILDIVADDLALSKDQRFLYISKTRQNKLEVYSNRGSFMGSCQIEGPAGIVHMS